MTKTIVKEQIVAALKNHTRKEAAIILGCCVDTLRKNMKIHGVDAERRGRTYKLVRSLPKQLSSSQQDILLGCMLGDGHIDKRGRFKIEQSVENERYVDHLFAQLSPFSTALKTQKARRPDSDGRIDDAHWDGTFIYKRRFQTFKCNVFYELRSVWYPNGVKIVPKSILLNENVLLHWFCQDGSNVSGFIRLHTNGFTVDDVEFLMYRLQCDLGIDSHITFHSGKPIIAIGSRDSGSNSKLVKMLQPLMNWDCFSHKVFWDEAIKRRITGTAR